MEMIENLQQKTKEELLHSLLFAQEKIEEQAKEKKQLETKLGDQESTIGHQASAIEHHANTIEQHLSRITQLEDQLRLLTQARYGSRSEKFPHPNQASLFDEALVSPEELPIIEVAEIDIQIASHSRKKSTGGRKALPEHLPREEILHRLPEDQKQCHCGCSLTKIGEVRSEQLDFIPAQMKVLVHVREKWACRQCEETIKTADLPRQPIPKSIASPGLLAHVLVCKYEDHLPLYRQENILQRIGVDIARSTLSHWVIRCGALLQPLVDRMHQMILHYDIAYADETPIQVLKEAGRSAESKSQMWYFAGGPKEKRCIVYEYHPTRAGLVARDFFKGYQGYLHCDGYAGYEALFAPKTIVHIACWAHARRKFAEIIQSNKKNPPGFAVLVINLLKKVYYLEKQFKEQALLPEEIYQRRQAEAKPILLDLKKRLEETYPKTPPGGMLAKAINYALNQWDDLMNYLLDGRLDIDNNASERGIKTFATGRKNWLFCDQPEGAHASSVIYSLIQTCKMHGIEPYAYFTHALKQIPHAMTQEQLNALLPFHYLQQTAPQNA
jgi:transposase